MSFSAYPRKIRLAEVILRFSAYPRRGRLAWAKVSFSALLAKSKTCVGNIKIYSLIHEDHLIREVFRLIQEELDIQR